MTGGSKIIGMWKDRDENGDQDLIESELSGEEDTLELGIGDRAFSKENESLSLESEDDDWNDYYETETTVTPVTTKIEIALISGLAAIWTGFFLWSNRDIFATILAAQRGIELLTQWSVPILLLGVIHLLFMRNSSREASRFTDVSNSLRSESEQLEARLKTINSELTIAREFLSNETRELEFLGEQSSQKLTTAAKRINTALEDGLSSMRSLDDVGESAFQNLEQLREHLPVVINTAKDVTNQIGNTGRTSQTEMAAMITTLKKVSTVSQEAKVNIEGLTDISNQSLSKLSDTAEEMSATFTSQFSAAENQSKSISEVLRNGADEIIEALRSAQDDLAKDTSDSTEAVKSSLVDLEATLTNLGSTVAEEEIRLKSIVAELQQHISEVNQDVASLDNESGEKTAKLAFGLRALEDNSQSLIESLEQGHGVADGMIERMERLLQSLDSSTREMDETIPTAFDRVDERSQSSLVAFEKLNREVSSVSESADAVSKQVELTNASLDDQKLRLNALKDDSSVMSEEIQSQIEILSDQIKDVKNQNEALVESAGEKLLNALLRVKETAKQASEYSRETLEKSITGSAEKFEQISEEALKRVIDEKVGSIAPKLEEAVANAVATTESTAGHLAGQLNAIEEMTTQLEQRILFAKEKAEQSSEENFTRRVALLTESLNSTAIDVSKILSNDVTDTEWAAYLKGDRGIFTRRAVRLLDNGEVREILAQYDANDEFREHVNRYIHDFEAMLRGVLSTRDGSAISVTLLSSDIGKLYVALAQAIERLRA